MSFYDKVNPVSKLLLLIARNILVYRENVGQTVLFQWIEKIKEYLMTLETELHIDNQDVCENEGNKVEFSGAIPEIIHGEQIVDRKSIFQGHASVVLSVNEVRLVMNKGTIC